MESRRESTQASAVLVAIGILIAIIGWMLTEAPSDGPTGLRGVGGGLIAVGGIVFGLGILIEFFSIGSSLRYLARHSQPPSSKKDAQPPSDIDGSRS